MSEVMIREGISILLVNCIDIRLPAIVRPDDLFAFILSLFHPFFVAFVLFYYFFLFVFLLF